MRYSNVDVLCEGIEVQKSIHCSGYSNNCSGENFRKKLSFLDISHLLPLQFSQSKFELVRVAGVNRSKLLACAVAVGEACPSMAYRAKWDICPRSWPSSLHELHVMRGERHVVFLRLTTSALAILAPEGFDFSHTNFFVND